MGVPDTRDRGSKKRMVTREYFKGFMVVPLIENHRESVWLYIRRLQVCRIQVS